MSTRFRSSHYQTVFLHPGHRLVNPHTVTIAVTRTASLPDKTISLSICCRWMRKSPSASKQRHRCARPPVWRGRGSTERGAPVINHVGLNRRKIQFIRPLKRKAAVLRSPGPRASRIGPKVFLKPLERCHLSMRTASDSFSPNAAKGAMPDPRECGRDWRPC